MIPSHTVTLLWRKFTGDRQVQPTHYRREFTECQHAHTYSIMVNSPNTSICIVTHSIMGNSMTSRLTHASITHTSLLQRHTLYYGGFTRNKHTSLHRIQQHISQPHILLWRIHQSQAGSTHTPSQRIHQIPACPRTSYYGEFTKNQDVRSRRVTD